MSRDGTGTGDAVDVRISVEFGAKAPVYASELAAGADLFAYLAAPLEIAPGARALVPTGMRMELPAGFEAQIRPRSGLAFKHGIGCLNSPGTIDADYRGEVKVLLVNLGEFPFTVNNGDRIAQMVVARVPRASFTPVDELGDSVRGHGGFGSTGS